MTFDITRENTISWDILAEMSKQETTDVHNMVLKRFQELDTESTHALHGTTPKPPTAPGMSAKYLSYPPADLPALMAEYKVTHWLKDYDLEWPEGLMAKTGGEATEGKRSKKERKKHNKQKHKQKAIQMTGADRIRQQQVRALATDTYTQHFGKRDRTTLKPDFDSKVYESVLLYYAYVTHYAFKDRVVGTFVDAALSLRDALKAFGDEVHPDVQQLMRRFFACLEPQFPWATFLKRYTHVLIRTHFKRRFQRALKPFPEQDQLLQAIHADPFNLYVLPWGVGTGKTAMLPPLSTLYAQAGHQTLYCVPFGPVRDQSAALLYRCGVPFAYVVEAPAALGTQWELQPSYHCGDGRMPHVYIVDPSFVKAYTLYWERFAALVGDEGVMDPVENPPDVYLPSRKKRYAHLSHAIWNPRWVLMLDEPSEEDDAVKWVLHHLPPTAFVMSATSWELVDADVQGAHEDRTGKRCVTVAARTVGVSTTLIGYWLEAEPVLSPFHGVRTRAEFAEKLAFVRDKILWRRFLSAEVLLDWAVRMKRAETGLGLPIAFELATLTFDSISERVLAFADAMLEHDSLDDAQFEAFFGFGAAKPDESCEARLQRLLTSESGKFMGGCILGTPTVEQTYAAIAPLLADCPTLDTMQAQLDEHRKAHVAKFAALEKVPVTKPEDRLRKLNQFRELEHQRWTTLPIPDRLVVNTPEYLQRYRQPARPSNGVAPAYLRVQDLVETGDPSKGVDGWRLAPDTMAGVTFARDHEDKLQWRWKGVGAIIGHKEFNMKNIRDLDQHTVGFLMLDTLGAQGLNLKIRHGVLLKGTDGSMLPTSTCLQVAGRVGRWGQDGTGYVYVADVAMFGRVFG